MNFGQHPNVIIFSISKTVRNTKYIWSMLPSELT